MITAEEFFRDKLQEMHPHMEVITLSQLLITAEQGMRWGYEYSILKAKLHVQEALKQANNNAKMYELTSNIGSSIVKAYPLENIK